MSRTWRIEFKDTVPNSNLWELSENDINMTLTLQGTGLSKTIRQGNRSTAGIPLQSNALPDAV